MLQSDASDHFATFATLDRDDNQNAIPEQTISFRDYRNINKEMLCEVVSDRLNTIPLSDDVDVYYQCIKESIVQSFNEHIPLITKTVKSKRQSKRWMTDELKQLIRERNKLFKKYLKRPITFGDEYRQLRNNVNIRLKTEKNNFIKNKLEQSHGNSKKVWTIVNDLLGRQSSKTNYIKSLKRNTDVISDSKDMANFVNNYFTSIGPTLSSKVPRSNRRPSDFLRGNYPAMDGFEPTTPSEVKRIIEKLKKYQPRF